VTVDHGSCHIDQLAVGVARMVTQHREGIRLVDRVALHALCQSLAVPASMKVLGDWNWYLPKWLEWLPRVGSEGGGP
jgi:hypothetical protein